MLATWRETSSVFFNTPLVTLQRYLNLFADATS